MGDYTFLKNKMDITTDFPPCQHLSATDTAPVLVELRKSIKNHFPDMVADPDTIQHDWIKMIDRALEARKTINEDVLILLELTKIISNPSYGDLVYRLLIKEKSEKIINKYFYGK